MLAVAKFLFSMGWILVTGCAMLVVIEVIFSDGSANLLPIVFAIALYNLLGLVLLTTRYLKKKLAS